MLTMTQIKKGENKEDNSNEAKPVHSLLFVKSIPTMRLEDSRPALARASVTFQYGKEKYFRMSQKQMNIITSVEPKVGTLIRHLHLPNAEKP